MINTINQLDLPDLYRVLYRKVEGRRTFFFKHKIDHLLDTTAYLNKFKRTESTFTIFSDHHGIKVEIKNRRNLGKFSSIWQPTQL